MELFEKLTQGTKIPETLFHYTDLFGFEGIVKTNQLWATNIHYLNDTNELSAGIKILIDEISKEIIESDSIYEIPLSVLETKLMDQIKDLKRNIICVFSFSEKDDLLSQWRGYGSNGTKISIGFDSSILNQLRNTESFILTRCIYNQEEQKNLMREIIKDEKKKHEFPELTDSTRDAFKAKALEFMNAVSQKAVKYAPLIKDKSFEEECEWRLIISDIDIFSNHYGYSNNGIIIKPFYKVNLPEKDSFKNLRIGPTEKFELIKHSVTHFLKKSGLNLTKISASSIPFRTW